MKKAILAIVITVLLVMAGGIIYVWTNLDGMVKSGIEKYGSEATQTDVRVDDVRIDITTGEGAIHGLSVANPEEFEMANAISLEEIDLGIDLKSIRNQPFVVSHVTVREPKVFAEINKDLKLNLSALVDNAKNGKPAGKDAAGDDALMVARLVIKRVTFEEGQIILKVTPLDKHFNLTLPTFSIDNIGRQEGATPAELAKDLVERLANAAKEQIPVLGIGVKIDRLTDKIMEGDDDREEKKSDGKDGKDKVGED